MDSHLNNEDSSYTLRDLRKIPTYNIMTHALKTWPEYFKAIHSGEKDFELRKDDRKYQVGEKIILQEWNPESETYTGNEVEKIIKYILRDAEKFGLKKGYIIMGLEDKNY